MSYLMLRNAKSVLRIFQNIPQICDRDPIHCFSRFDLCTLKQALRYPFRSLHSICLMTHPMPFCEFLPEEIGIPNEPFESQYNLGPCKCIHRSIEILRNSILSQQMPSDHVPEDKQLLMEKVYSVPDMILCQ